MCAAAPERILSVCQERPGAPDPPGSGIDTAGEEIAMYGTIEILVDCRRADLLADAARERLAKEARSTQPLAPLAGETM